MFKRGGRWWIKIHHEGRVVQRSTGTGDIKLARQIEAQVRAELARGRFFEARQGEDVTVSELLRLYFERHLSTKKETTRETAAWLAKKLSASFGALTLLEVTPEKVRSYIENRLADGVSETTIHHELALLKHTFKLAVTGWDLIERSPFDKISLPRGDKQRTRFLSQDEADTILRESPEWLKLFIVIALDTGLRLSNIINLTWKQVDLFARAIRIETTKNRKPVSIPMTERVVEVLAEIKSGRNLSLSHVFVQPAADRPQGGRPYTRDMISKAFKRVCRKVGIEDFNFHGLRHTFCSWLAIEGANPVDIAALAGHSNLRSTMRYAHLNDERKREVIKRLEKPGRG